MGTDITVCIEKKNKETGQWEDLHLYYKKNGEFEKCLIYPGRCHSLFSLLSNVGTGFYWPYVNQGYLVDPRGIPSDASDYTKECYGNGEYFFGATWYDYQELSTYAHLLNEANNMMNKKNARIKELEKEVKKLDTEIKRSLYGCNVDDDWEECEYLDEEENVVDYLNGFMTCINNVLEGCCVYNPSMGEVRIIMWFDN